MAIKVTKRPTNEGCRYSITGLSFDQIFRVKQAMYAEEKKMKEIASELRAHENEREKDFEQFARDAHEVFIAIAGEI